jgi:hypothetical protein
MNVYARAHNFPSFLSFFITLKANPRYLSNAGIGVGGSFAWVLEEDMIRSRIRSPTDFIKMGTLIKLFFVSLYGS